MSAVYETFLAEKSQHNAADGFEPIWLPDWLFGFQRSLVEWAIRMGRAAVFADCGMGKTPMQLVWAENVYRKTGKPVLIITPLAVSFQTEAEAAKFEIEAAVSRDGTISAPITITNYERLEKFDTNDFGGVVCDESSAIKSFDGSRRAIVTEFMRTHRYRLLCTATAAPNDYVELGTSSEALGYLGYSDMLSRFFTNKEQTSVGNGSRYRLAARGGPEWRFKGHAPEPFWKWVASWARAVRKPSDLGFSDDGFDLPRLDIRRHLITAATPRAGQLFDVPAFGIREEREDARRTLNERCEMAADLIRDAESAVAWCHLNAESDTLEKLIPDAVQIAGGESPEAKENKLLAFSRGEIRVLVTKPSIGAWGLNWQHCHRMTYFPSHSYEQWYQAIRRCWRFGQKHSVIVDSITTDGGENIQKNLERKSLAADAMFDALVLHMRGAVSVDSAHHFDKLVEVPQWAK